jgi:hypothetical protein
MANTTNFNWETPDDTDLVKDGAAAIRTLGNSIDTSFVDLKGGTTGQILSKASNTDLDYTWIANDQGDITEVQAGTGISVASGTGPIPVVTNTVATAYDAKGDLVVGTGADTFAKLTVGTNDYVLTAASGETTGLKWAAPASGGGLTLLDTMTLSGSSTTSATFSSSYKYLEFYFKSIYGSASANSIKIRFNADTGSNYAWHFVVAGGSEAATSQTAIRLGTINSHSATLERLYGTGRLWRPSDTDVVYFEADCVVRSGSNPEWSNVSAIYDNSAAITSFTIAPDSGTFTAGTVYIYGGN